MSRFVLITLLFLTSFSLCSDDYEKAYLAYHKGEEAQTVQERASYFNEALKLYKLNEKEDGKIYYNIANCYYQLNQTGMAIWYYTKAERLLPRDLKIKENLFKAKGLAQVPISSWDKILRSVFFFHYQLKIEEKALFLIFVSALLALLISFSIWIKKSFFKPLIFVFAFFSLSFGLSYLKSSQSNKEGIFVEPSLLRCDAGMQYKEVDNQIINEGQKFKVLEISEDHKWIKVRVDSHMQGYVLAQHVRLL